MSEDKAFTVDRLEEKRFLVVGPAGRTVLQCADEHSAQHYASLMNQAYLAGYKAGFRNGKSSSSKR